MTAPRILFMGTPEFALESLTACLEVGEVVAVVTQPDKARDRGRVYGPSPVKRMAADRGLVVMQPTRLRDPAFVETVRGLDLHVAVVTAYGKILPRDLLLVPRRGCVNVHASLLPRFRGAAPIQWAIASGDEKTGVCLMKIDDGLDTGPVIACAEAPIHPDDTFGSLAPVLARLGGRLIRQFLPPYLRGEIEPVAQPVHGIVLAPMLKKEDGLLDFQKPAVELERRVRAFQPWPGSFVHFRGEGLKVHRASVGEGQGAIGTVLGVGARGIEVACGVGSLFLSEVQLPGKRPMSAAAFLAGHQISVGDRPFTA